MSLRATAVALVIIFSFIEKSMALNCAPLDPREVVSKETETELKGKAQTLFRIGKAEGDFRRRAKEEATLLYRDHPNYDALILKSKLIYLYCTLLDSSELTPTEQGRMLHELTEALELSSNKSRHSSDPPPPPTANQLSPGTSRRGSLAKNSFDYYSFVGSANVPVLFAVQPTTDHLDYLVTIFDSVDFELDKKKACCGNPINLAFTPPTDGTYKVQLKGTGRHGDYNLVMKLLAGDRSSRNIIIPLAISEGQRGTLAKKSVDMYHFTGRANLPVLFSVQPTTEHLDYQVTILNPEKKKLSGKSACCGNSIDLAFTPPVSGDYLVQLTGTGRYGDYNFVMRPLRPR